MSSGNYVICDKDNYAYINAVTRVVRYKLKDASDPTQGIVLDKQINLQDYNSNIQTMVGLVMTYDGGPEAPSIKMGFGSGSTPTLMGFGDDEDKLVVITDGAKRVKLAAFWRDEIPTELTPSSNT